MKQNASFLSKLTRPSPTRIFKRTRLFRLLDRARKQSLIWVSGPPGSGKTTLIASYLSTSLLPALWYQIDSGDVDPATFFHYLGLAVAQAAPRYRRAMPKLTPEYLGGMPTFTRNFFRELARRLNKPCVLVFDNLHEIDADSPLNEILREGLSELPPHLHSILISRCKPPPVFARMQMSKQISELDWEALRLRREESVQFVRFLGHDDSARTIPPASRLHEQCEGWMAGLILLLQGAKGTTSARNVLDPATAQSLFDYFAAEVFARRPPAVREFLMLTALFPGFTSGMAERMCGHAHAVVWLNDLVRSHLFTEHRAEPGGGYQYHPLFRAFLLHNAREDWGPAELARRRHRAATLLDEAGRTEEALALYLDAGDYAAATRLILQRAPVMAAEGRFIPIGQVIERLPAAECDPDPWLRFWLGVSRLPMDPGAALPYFDAAFEAFERNHDSAGGYLAWAGAADAIGFQMRDYGQYAPWLDRLDRMTEAYPEFPNIEIETRVLSAALIACLWHRPSHPSFVAWMRRAEILVRACNNPAACARLVFHWLICAYWYSDNGPQNEEMLEYATNLFEHLERAPFEQILIKQAEAMTTVTAGNTKRGLRAMERVLEISAGTGIHMMDLMAMGMGVWGSLGAGQMNRADALLQRIHEGLKHFGSNMDRVLDSQARSWRAAAAGEVQSAQRHLVPSLQLNEEVGVIPAITNAWLAAAHYHLELVELDAARAALARADALLSNTPQGRLWYLRAMVGAQLAFAENREAEGCERLGEALRLSRRMGYLNDMGLISSSVARLFALALEKNIEPDAALAFIRKFKLVPPDIGIPAWPWPVKIHTLGRFGVVLDGRPLRFEGKAQRRPLELLMALISLGGREVGEPRLCEALWEEAEADAARVAFKSALYRLRKLLCDDEALLLNDNRLSLNPNRVWVDAWAFERALARSEKGATADGDQEQAMALYQGSFLADSDAPWALPAREKLRAKFLRCLTQASRGRMKAGRHEEGLRMLDRGLEADPLAEELHRQIILCQAALGHRAEALAAYERCRKTLSTMLGIEPAPETEALHRALHENRPLSP